MQHYMRLDLGDMGAAVSALPPLNAFKTESAAVSLAPTPVSTHQNPAKPSKTVADSGLYSAPVRCAGIDNKDEGGALRQHLS